MRGPFLGWITSNFFNCHDASVFRLFAKKHDIFVDVSEYNEKKDIWAATDELDNEIDICGLYEEVEELFGLRFLL